MEEQETQQTCGKGLADRAPLPAKMAELIGNLAENLELHQKTLDLSEEHARREHQVYVKLATAYRTVAKKLESTARLMEGYRDLPMGRHDEQSPANTRIGDAFTAFVESERELLGLLQEMIEKDEEMLVAMKG